MKKIISLILALMLILPCFSMISISAEGGTEDKIIGATLNLGSTLTIDYYATVASGNENAQMKFTSSSGRISTVSGVYDETLSAYKYKWFNPRTAEYSSEMTFISSSTGTWNAPDKTTGDMVLYIYK